MKINTTVKISLAIPADDPIRIIMFHRLDHAWYHLMGGMLRGQEEIAMFMQKSMMQK